MTLIWDVNANKFYYIWGGVKFARQGNVITAIVRNAYHLYFGCKIGDQDKSWAPHICCRKCATEFRRGWMAKSCDAVCCPYVAQETKKSHNWLLLLYCATCFWRHHDEKEVDSSVFEYLPLVHFHTAKEFPFLNLRWKLPSIQTMRTKASRPRVLLSRWRLLNLASPTVGLRRHSHTFSNRKDWTILFAIWSCPKPKQTYWDQDLNNEIFSRNMSEFLRFAVVISSWCFLQKGIWPCVLPRCRWPDECPRNQTWPARMAAIYV